MKNTVLYLFLKNYTVKLYHCFYQKYYDLYYNNTITEKKRIPFLKKCLLIYKVNATEIAFSLDLQSSIHFVPMIKKILDVFWKISLCL